jgi:hypothetical protein
MATSGELTQTVSKALGVPFETAREHLRVIRRVPNTITFSGYGRSAASMTPRDAVRLMLAVAGSQFVKDAKATLDAFRKLQPLKFARRQGDLRERPPNLEEHLIEMMNALITSRDDLPPSYLRHSRAPKHGAIALTLMSGATTGKEPPRAAIARRYSDSGGATAVSFASPGWSSPVLSEVEYAIGLPEVGLVYSHHVTTWAFAEIALSL